MINNRYSIVKQIGHGGMGLVYLVTDTLRYDMPLALKTIRQEVLTGHDRSVTESFKNEYEIMTRLKHPNLVRVYEFGEYSDNYYILMEYLRGSSLYEACGGFRQKLDFLVDTLRTLEYIHSRDIVYRDIKPSNIMVVDGTVKLMDFGLSGFIHNQTSKLSGSLLYMAPEALKGNIRYSNDIYSLGITFYGLFTGIQFFEGICKDTKKLISLLNCEESYNDHMIRRLAQISDTAIKEIIAGMISFRIEARYDNCADIIHDINLRLGLDYEYETTRTKHSYVLGNAFANRRNELKYLENNLFSKDPDNIVIFSGVAGTGKTRLFSEFEKYCRLNNISFFGTSCMEGEINQYWSICEILSCMIADSKNHILEKHGKYLKLILPDNYLLKKYKAPVIIGNPALLKDIIVHNVSAFIIEFVRSANKVTILYFNDLQWLDAGSMYILTNLVKLLAIHKGRIKDLFIYANISSGHKDPLTLNIQRTVKTELQPLDIDAVNEYIQNIFGAGFIAPGLKDSVPVIRDKVGSNPLFLQELIKSLLDNDIIVKDKRYWKLSKSIEDAHIPDNIIEIIKERLLSIFMDEKKKVILNILSLLKVDLDINTLKTIFDNATGIDSSKMLLELENLEIITVNTIDNVTHYAYTNSIIKECVRKSIHNSPDISLFLARALESVSENKPGHLMEEIAYQYNEGREIKKAACYYEKCGDLATESNFNNKALSFYQTVLKLLDGPDITDMVQKIRVMLKTAGILELTGKWKDAIEVSQDALCLSKNIQDSKLIIDCMNKIGQLELKLGKPSESKTTLGKAVEFSERSGYEEGLYDALANTASYYYYRGDYDNTMKVYKRMISMCSKDHHQNRISNINVNMGNIYYLQGNYDKAMDSYQKRINLCENMGDKKSVSYALGNIGNIYYIQENFDIALNYYNKKLQICKELGDKKGMGQSIANIGNVSFCRGEYKKAMELYRKHLMISEEIGDRRGVSYAACNIANAYYYSNDYDKAMEYYKMNLEICKELRDKRGTCYVMANLASVFMDRGVFDKALEYYEEAIIIARSLDLKYELSGYLFFKANLIFQMSVTNSGEAENILNEAIHIAMEINREDLIFKAKVLKHRIKNNRHSLIEMLEDKKLNDEQQAIIYYELWKMTKENHYGEKARNKYKYLTEKTPKFEYLKTLRELESVFKPLFPKFRSQRPEIL